MCISPGADEQKKELQKKAADIQFAITIATISAQTAQSMSKDMATIPAPFDIIAAASDAVFGAVQLASAYQQWGAVQSLGGGTIDENSR